MLFSVSGLGLQPIMAHLLFNLGFFRYMKKKKDIELSSEADTVFCATCGLKLEPYLK